MTHRSGYAALIGRPNVGKSSLLNRFLGQKLTITSHKPQTTRHSILGINTRQDGQIIYIDTPGIHKRGGKAMNRYLNRTAHTAMLDVDVVVFVVEALVWTEEDEAVLKALKNTRLPVIAAVNKVDKIKPRNQLLPFLQSLQEKHKFSAIVPASARNGDNCDNLESEIISHLPVGENIFPEEQVSDRSERFFAAELIREQIIRLYHKELPYSVTVEIEKFEETPDLYRIGAVIWVERDSQRGILLGKGGGSLKTAATSARKALENFLQTRVFLEIWIKVRKSWASDEASLIKLGYGE